MPLASLTAYQFVVTHGKLQGGQRVLFIGANGDVGNFVVQFSKAIAAIIIAVSSHRNTELVRSLGAGQVTDYTTTKSGSM